MIESLVDYVLQRGHLDYGEFAHREEVDPNTAMFNHRKLLAYLFAQNDQHSEKGQSKLVRRISDLKLQEISGQLNYFSEKIHAQLSKYDDIYSRKHLNLDGDLYRMENQWLRKKMPDFYCYYFLKFSYANSYSRMHELFLSEIQHMANEKDSYSVLKKTIEARQSCLTSLRRMIMGIKQLQIQQSLHTIKQQREMKKKIKVSKEHTNYQQKGEQGGKSWKNELQVLFENITHLRKLTCYVVELIRLWRNSIYNISEDPRRYRQRVIFYYNDSNYLLKMLFDSNFIKDSFLNKYVQFSNNFDPFLLKPTMILENKKHKSTTEDIFMELIKPTQLDMDKITKALVMLAQEEYDEDQQSRFINERKNYGELQQRKQFIERRRDTLGIKKVQSQKVLPQKPSTSRESRVQLGAKGSKDPKIAEFVSDKRSGSTQKQLQGVKNERKELLDKRSRVQTSLNKLKLMKASDLKKISPYLSRNQRIQKAQKVIELQHKFKVAQNEYSETVKRTKQQQVKQKIKSSLEANKQTINSKIFNRYIQQNLKLMDQANKKAYLYKNNNQLNNPKISSTLNYNKVPFHQRKEAEYQKNLQKYYPKQQTSPIKRSNIQINQITPSKGTKNIIQISNKGVRANEKIIQFELSNKKGKNIGNILNQRQRLIEQDLSKSKQYYNQKQSPNHNNQSQVNNSSNMVNLFNSQKQQQILIIRQEPQKIQEIKQFLYTKIKQQLLEEMRRNAENKDIELDNMIQEEKRKKLQEIIQERQRQEERRRLQEERLRLALVDRERKKLTFQVRIQPIQYAEENVQNYFTACFGIQETIYHRLFTNQKIQVLKEGIMNQMYYIFLKGYYQNQDQAFCIAHFDWQYTLHRKIIIDYLSVKQPYLYISTLYRITDYLWNNDPVQQIEIVMYKNMQNIEGLKVFEDVQIFAQQTGQVFQKELYSNITQYRFIWMRPSNSTNIQFPFTNYYFGKLLSFKAQLLSASISFHERHTPIIDMTLQTFTSYIFLLEQLFRSYLTPEEVVELRQNSTNIRRLKDIFRIVLQLQKSNPIVDELTIAEGINLDDLYNKIKDKKMAPYDRYYWHHFYDKANANRLLLSILQLKPQLKYLIQSCHLNDRKFMRINCKQKILILKSSIYADQNIYILDTHNPKIKLFLMQGQHYKLMRMELFIFLNIIFNNIVQDSQKFINSIWLPQFVVSQGNQGKRVKRITDFSISMKKSFFLSEQIYFANHQYIKHAISLIPKQSDIIFRESFIFGFMHTEIEESSTGMPLYAKLIDKDQMFNIIK